MGTSRTAAWQSAIEGYLAHLRAGAYSTGTIALRRSHLMKLARDVRPTRVEKVNDDVLVAWLGSQGWKPNTMRSYRSTTRDFYQWAVRRGVVEQSPAELLPRVSIPRAKPRPTPEDVLEEALIIADERQRRAVHLAGHCGLRVGEIARVHRSDLERDLEGWNLRVVGKGGHERIVPLPDFLARDLLALPDGWVFPSSARAGNHLTPHHLGKVVARTLAGRFTTHTLRHRCGTIAYQTSLDIRAVQELLGHAKLETTQVYTEVSRTAIRRAMLGAAPPQHRPRPRSPEDDVAA